jgi:phage-related protein
MASQATLAVLLTLKDDLSSGLKNAAKEASGFGGVLKGLGVGIASVATAAVAAGVASVKSFADTGDALKEMAQKTGFSTESLSTLKYAAEQCGASLDTIGVAVRGVAGFMQQVGAGSEPAINALNQLGLSAEQLKGLSSEETFNKLALAIAGIEDPLQKAALAQDVFGKSGMELLPLLAEGPDGMKKLADEAKELGLVFSQDAADNADAFNDALGKLQGAFSGLMNQVGAKLVPALQPLIDAFTKLVTALPIEQIGQLISSLLPPLVEVIMQLLQALAPVIDAVLQFAVAALKPLLAVLPKIVAALTPILTIVGQLVGMFGGVIAKIVELAMAVLEPILIPVLNLVATLLEAFMPLIEMVMNLLSGVIEFLTPILTKVGEVLGFIVNIISKVLVVAIKAVVDFFKGAADNIKANWEKLGQFFTNLWEGIKNGFKAAVNFLIGLAEGFVNFWIKALNMLIGALNKISFNIPDWVPLIGGKQFGINISPIPEISLPRLAEGGIVNRPTAALIGERGPEAVIPLSRNLMPPIEIHTTLEVDGRRMAEVVEHWQDRRFRIQQAA